jgi:hypothetical protein
MGSGHVLVMPVAREHMKTHFEGFLWTVLFLSLIVAGMTTSKFCLMVLAVIWILSSTIAIPLHFYKAWRRLRQVPNQRQYGVWVGFESIATVAFIGLLLCSFFSH